MVQIGVRWKGFTLIEIMIVVAIVAILVAVALPAYTDYVRRGNIPEATTCLSQWRTNMEQYFQDHRDYNTNPACATVVCAGKNFDVDLACPDATTYLITATGKTGTWMENFIFTLDQTNARTSDTPWAGPQACWITKKGATC